MENHIDLIDFIVCKDEKTARQLEAELIMKYKPKLNVIVPNVGGKSGFDLENLTVEEVAVQIWKDYNSGSLWEEF